MDIIFASDSFHYNMLKLKDKVAVVYGNGAVGGEIAKTFACEGATVFLAGRTWEKLKKIADEITAKGGEVETAQVDALNESSVEEHMNELVKKAGKIDISFNAMGLSRTDLPRTLLAELSIEDFFY